MEEWKEVEEYYNEEEFLNEVNYLTERSKDENEKAESRRSRDTEKLIRRINRCREDRPIRCKIR